MLVKNTAFMELFRVSNVNNPRVTDYERSMSIELVGVWQATSLLGITYKNYFESRRFYVLKMIGNCGSYTHVSITIQSHFYELTQDILTLPETLTCIRKNEG